VFYIAASLMCFRLGYQCLVGVSVGECSVQCNRDSGASVALESLRSQFSSRRKWSSRVAIRLLKMSTPDRNNPGLIKFMVRYAKC
jgi:hypothetical protein